MKMFAHSVEIVRRRWMLVAATLVIGLIGAAFLFQHVPRTYEASSQVLIVNENDGRDPSVSSVDLPSVATSTVVLQSVLDQLKLPISLIDMKKHIKARVGQRSSIMDISYRDSSPDRAVAVPNAVAEELSRYYEQISSGRADTDVRKLDTAIADVSVRLRDINGRLAQQSAAQPYVDSDKSLDTVTERLDDLMTQRELANATLANDIAAQQAISGDRATLSKVARHEILQNDPLYKQLSDGTAKDAAQLAFDHASYTDRYPALPGLEAKTAAERATMAAEAKRSLSAPDAFSASDVANEMESRKAAAIVEGDRAKVSALDSLIATAQERLKDVPAATASTAWLKLQRDAAQADYLTLSSRRTAALADRAEALSLGSVVVVDRAVKADTAVVGLGRKSLAIVTAALVIAFSIGMAFLVEMLDPRIRRADQIENLYGTPLIATLKKGR
jgi:capsular polysaccharide biosynthesis protein